MRTEYDLIIEISTILDIIILGEPTLFEKKTNGLYEFDLNRYKLLVEFTSNEVIYTCYSTTIPKHSVSLSEPFETPPILPIAKLHDITGWLYEYAEIAAVSAKDVVNIGFNPDPEELGWVIVSADYEPEKTIKIYSTWWIRDFEYNIHNHIYSTLYSTKEEAEEALEQIDGHLITAYIYKIKLKSLNFIK